MILPETRALRKAPCRIRKLTCKNRRTCDYISAYVQPVRLNQSGGFPLRPMHSPKFAMGDWVLYRKSKLSVSPGPRAKAISPASKGDTYSYFVDKFWVVQELLTDGRLRVRTRRGKCHLLEGSDPSLRRANFWERWIYRDRFRKVEGNVKLSSTTVNDA